VEDDAMEALVGRLHALCEAQPFDTAWYFKDLVTGFAADRRGEVVVASASTRKIAILMTALRAVHAGVLSLTQPVVLRAEYQTSNSGCFQHFLPGFTLPLRDVLIMMIIVSDNTCTGTVVDMVGLDTVNAFGRSVGMAGTVHREAIPADDGPNDAPDLARTNVTTPADVGRLLELILLGTRDRAAAARLGCSPALCRLAIDILTWQRLQQRLPLLLPPGATVANKGGTGGNNFSDAGIVFEGDRARFVLTVYTRQVPAMMPDGTPGKAAASFHIGRLCRSCWDALRPDRVPV
jgi:beta-lactamase class A